MEIIRDILAIGVDGRSYLFWLLVTGVVVFAAERVFAWRRGQPALRRGFWQDLFFLVFNGHVFSLLVSGVVTLVLGWLALLTMRLGWPRPDELRLMGHLSLPGQFLVLWVVKDFLEWAVHILLHRVPWLWNFHKLHHTITDMDFLGSFRFHWMELVIYGVLRWLPLAVLGVSGKVLLSLAVFTTFLGYLNHANLPWSYGPLRYVFNSPRMHIWHHDAVQHRNGGQNFGITLSVFDWVFGTAYWPTDEDQPARLGFPGDESFPRTLAGRLLYPFSSLLRRLPLLNILR